MSSSPALDTNPQRELQVRPFPYANAVVGVTAGGETPARDAIAVADSLAIQEEEQRRQEAARIAAARQEGEAQARKHYEEHLEQVRGKVRQAIEDFAQERANYYRQVEGEIVQLALSIARKVLSREARVDTLLLAGLVRVALDRIESHTKVTVRVNPQEADDCRAFFARTMEPQRVPEVVEDGGLEPDRSVLETELGTTEIGIEVQLKEIERGLLDLLAQRPTGK